MQVHLVGSPPTTSSPCDSIALWVVGLSLSVRPIAGLLAGVLGTTWPVAFVVGIAFLLPLSAMVGGVLPLLLSIAGVAGGGVAGRELCQCLLLLLVGESTAAAVLLIVVVVEGELLLEDMVI